MPDDPIFELVRDIVATVAGPTRTPADAGPETPLAEGGFWLDSIDILQVIAGCESQFGVLFEGETDVTTDSLETLRSLTELVRRTGGC